MQMLETNVLQYTEVSLHVQNTNANTFPIMMLQKLKNDIYYFIACYIFFVLNIHLQQCPLIYQNDGKGD